MFINVKKIVKIVNKRKLTEGFFFNVYLKIIIGFCVIIILNHILNRYLI